MVVIHDHDMIDIGEGSILIDVIKIDVSDNESYRNDPDFVPTPNGTPYWRPDLPEYEKPKLGDIFDTFDDGYNMYKVCSKKGRFNIHDDEKDGNTKRKRKTVSRDTNCSTMIGLKVIHGTECYKLFVFLDNHNDSIMNENNMDLSRAQHQLYFSDYIYIHRASLSNIGPTLAHRLKVAVIGGYDKVRGTPGYYRNFKHDVNLFIGDRDAQMIVDKMINRQLHVPKFSFEHHVLHDELVSMFCAYDTMKCNYTALGDVVSIDATFRTNNNNMQTQTSNTLHNAIMESGSKDRPPMLAPGNYVQWKSRIKRYIDTKPNHELIHYCLENPPYKLDWKDIEVLVSEGSPITTTARIHETYKNVSQKIRDQLNTEVEAVQIILT
nr:hypothetical protein [Tanacetum cinerariifolium]